MGGGPLNRGWGSLKGDIDIGIDVVVDTDSDMAVSKTSGVL